MKARTVALGAALFAVLALCAHSQLVFDLAQDDVQTVSPSLPSSVPSSSTNSSSEQEVGGGSKNCDESMPCGGARL